MRNVESLSFATFYVEFRSSVKISLSTHVAELEVAKWWLI
jgi:hypothetical protein